MCNMYVLCLPNIFYCKIEPVSGSFRILRYKNTSFGLLVPGVGCREFLLICDYILH